MESKDSGPIVLPSRMAAEGWPAYGRGLVWQRRE
jgi:hypothetical protein